MTDTTPRLHDELRTAADKLRERDTWEARATQTWLLEVARLHAPHCGRCERDFEPWPCADIEAARKAADAIRLSNPAA